MYVVHNTCQMHVSLMIFKATAVRMVITFHLTYVSEVGGVSRSIQVLITMIPTTSNVLGTVTLLPIYFIFLPYDELWHPIGDVHPTL